ncbi:MAG TPA: biotin transporter BioY [Acidimicrobiia bacterium]|nr:biotin transporter BioY [Acidimicrobiia bacterium]
MTTAPAVISTRVLPRTRVTTAALVVGFALLTALAAQIEIPLWFTPVPITGQTFAVLLAGAALGMKLGAASQALYWGLGAVGLPFYSGGEGGWTVATGATAGYLVGFVVAAALVGALAERKQDRSVLTAVPAFLAGSALIYLFGVTWLMFDLGVDSTRALELGMTPFVVGDLVKIALAGLALPAAWRLVDRR